MNKIEKLRESLSKQSVDGILITNPYNRRYLTNFTGTAGVVLITESAALFITDFRYTEQASSQAKGFSIIKMTETLPTEVAAQVSKLGVKKLGFEQDHLSYAQFKVYEEKINAELIPVENMVEDLRITKSASEINSLKEAAEIADATFTYILDVIKPGLTELDVSNELEFFMRKAGATSSSFDIIVASGRRSALPHGVATNKVIEKGDFVTLDFGALHNGYVSDITRTISVGEPSEKLREMYDIVLKAQLHALLEIKPGISGKQADATARNYIVEHGYGEQFGHSLGHGIGLEVHEGPYLSMTSKTILEPGMVVTVEPGLYVPGVGGVRIEDDTLITENGNEKLTHSTKELLIL